MSSQNDEKRFLLTIIKSVIFAIITTLVCVLIFAILVKLASLGVVIIKSINQFIKIISVFMGCLFNIRGKLGYLQGGISGLFYSILIYLIFSFMGGGAINFSQMMLDSAFMAIIGGISGIIAVNKKSAT